MDIYGYLKKDHRKVADLMEQVLASPEPAERQALFETIRTELTLHADSEEKTFYKAIEDATRSQSVEEKMEHAHHEHDEIRDYLHKLEGLSPDEEKWIETFGEFKHSVTHHVEEEEEDIFTKARKYITADEATQLARDMDALKAELREKGDVPQPALAGQAAGPGLGHGKI